MDQIRAQSLGRAGEEMLGIRIARSVPRIRRTIESPGVGGNVFGGYGARQPLIAKEAFLASTIVGSPGCIANYILLAVEGGRCLVQNHAVGWKESGGVAQPVVAFSIRAGAYIDDK